MSCIPLNNDNNRMELILDDLYKTFNNFRPLLAAIAAGIVSIAVVLLGILALGIWNTAHHEAQSIAETSKTAQTAQTASAARVASEPAPATTAPAASSEPAAASTGTAETITIHVAKGNTLSLVAWDLYPHLTDGCKSPAEAYRDVAVTGSGSALPSPDNPNMLLAGQVLLLPAVITVCGETKTADVARANRRSELRGSNQAQASDASIAATIAPAYVADTLLTGSQIAMFNVQSNIPAANIAAFGTIGQHAPPNGNASRKENFECGNCG